MLKIIYFDGYLVVDVPEGGRDFLNSFELDHFAREAIGEYSCDFKVTSQEIVNPSDIPHDWENCVPINRRDDKTCIDIFYDEILPKQPIDDSNQTKFGFFKETLTGGNADG